MFKNYGKIFKADKKYDKAIVAFEESYYLACVLELLPAKIEIIASMTSCYLKLENMPKVIVYYHKLLDIEYDLKKLSKEILVENMNLNLRLAIRQNLFTANLRLGKLQTCCECLKEEIDLIDENIVEVTNMGMYNDLLKTKFSVAIELSKLYIVEKNYVESDKLLKNQFKYIQEVAKSKNEVDKENLTVFEIKIIAYMSLSAAGLCEMRLSMLLSKKVLCKIEKEMKQLENLEDKAKKETYLKNYLNLQIECLLIVSDACTKRIEVRREMNAFEEHRTQFDFEEIKLDETSIVKDSELRITYAKEAFQKSRSLIDAKIRIQTAHGLGVSLYDSQLYESASYYFDEALSVSKTLLKPSPGDNLQPDNEEFNMNDAKPDYHLEATIYWISCQIFLKFMHYIDEDEKRKELDSLLNRALKTYSKLESCIKLQKLNRLKNLSYATNSTGKDYKYNKNNSEKNLSNRWKNLFDLCVDCIIFLCYKLEKYSDCIFYHENSQYLINMDADYISHHFQYFYSPTKPPATSFSTTTDITMESEINQAFQQDRMGEIKSDFNSFNELIVVINESNIPVVIFRFIFNCKFLYSFIIEPDNGIVYRSETKIKDVEILRSLQNDKDSNSNLSPLFSNEIHYLCHKFDLHKNNYIKASLHKIENRSIASKFQSLINIRNSNYLRDKRFRKKLNSVVVKPIETTKSLIQTIQEEAIDTKSDITKRQSAVTSNQVIHQLQQRYRDEPLTTTNTINDNEYEISDIDIEHFKIDFNHLISEADSQNNNLNEKSDTNSLKGEAKHTILKLLKIIFLKPLEHKLSSYYCDKKVVNFCTAQEHANLLVYALNSCSVARNDFKIPNYVITLESVFLLSNAALISSKREKEDHFHFELLRESILNGPERVKNIYMNSETFKIEKESIKPHLTSNPRLAIKLINENPDDPYIDVDNSHYKRLMKHFDDSISTLISETATGTNVKTSNLEVLNYYQLNDEAYKTYVIGCPALPETYEKLYKTTNKKYLVHGFEELNEVAKIMYCDAVFNERATKLEFLTQLTNSAIIHITTFSSNDSDSYLVFSVSNSLQPHLSDETNKFCVITCEDLNNVYLDKCKLLVLSCYSLKYHQPRYDLAKKILKRGCQALLLILTPLPNHILQEFYKLFYNNIKKPQYLAVAYLNAIHDLVKNLNLNDDDYDLVISSMCLISSTNMELSIDDIGKNMLQLKIDQSLDKYKFKTSKENILNYEPKKNFMSIYTDLEKVLIQLQLEFKMLLSDLINILVRKSTIDYLNFKDICTYITVLISNSIEYIKQEKIAPEELSNIIKKNKHAINILTCLGFNFQVASVEPSSLNNEEKNNDIANYNKAFITYPNLRFLDLNLRMSHVITSINNLCFNDFSASIELLSSASVFSELSDPNKQTVTKSVTTNLDQFDFTYANAISNFHALLPIEDKKLLSCLIDILALTKFSPEILLSITDFSADYAINYYKKKNVEIRDNLTRASARSVFASSIDNNYFSNQTGRKSNVYSKNQELRKYEKIDISNKVINFLFSIGYEIIGLWLRFQDISTNRQLLDHMLKILTSFSTDRDMSLYRELNVSVLGQRSANPKVFPADAKIYSLNPVILPNSNVAMITTWANVVETQEEMQKKVRFTEKFMKISKRRSDQRISVLKHHLNYAAEQRKINESMNSPKRSSSVGSTNQISQATKPIKKPVEKLKYHPGGKPIIDRKIVDEKISLTLDQMDQIREYSHYLCRKRLDKIETEHNEKLEKLVLPYIANNFK